MTKNAETDRLLEIDGEIQVAPQQKIKRPKLFKVVLFNDNYTTMEFVVDILMSIFNKPEPDATRIMLEVHKKGKGVCGIYTFDIALTKTNQVRRYAILNEFPLRCEVEEA